MIDFKGYEVWFITGSQHLYGNEVLKKVVAHSRKMANVLDHDDSILIKIVFKSLLTTPEEVSNLCIEANSNKSCVGLICWMHTFSPAKMWINGLRVLQKPMLHFHTQYNAEIPWSEIDMNFMNLNQSAHGGREFGHINSRMRLDRKVVVGHWQDTEVISKIAVWTRVAAAWTDSQHMKIARFGDNMRQVAVTEGDKVAAQIQFGYSVNGYGLGHLADHTNAVSDNEIDATIDAYFDAYSIMESLYKSGDQHDSLREAARIEIGMRAFLIEGGFRGFTTTFENLTGLTQLPGIAVQRLMSEGYGFGAEGDWKTAALVRSMKVMAHQLEGGNSFMEDYTYHFNPQRMAVLGAHMLEICPSIASGKPSCEIHPLGIGGKSDPVRLVFQGGLGPALNASVINMGGRFRLLVNTVEAIEPEAELPKLPVARVLWQAHPDLKSAAAAWILAGGAHHTCYSQNLSTEYLEDFAEMAGVEYVLIDEHTKMNQFKKELKWNDLYYHLNRGVR